MLNSLLVRQFFFFCSLYTSNTIQLCIFNENTTSIDRFCRPIMMKPKPVKPATPEAPSPASSQGGESQSHGAENPNSSPGQNTDESRNEASSTEPMETDKSQEWPNCCIMCLSCCYIYISCWACMASSVRVAISDWNFFVAAICLLELVSLDNVYLYNPVLQKGLWERT